MTIFLKNLTVTPNYKDFLFEKLNYFNISPPFVAGDEWKEN